MTGAAGGRTRPRPGSAAHPDQSPGSRPRAPPAALAWPPARPARRRLAWPPRPRRRPAPRPGPGPGPGRRRAGPARQTPGRPGRGWGAPRGRAGRGRGAPPAPTPGAARTPGSCRSRWARRCRCRGGRRPRPRSRATPWPAPGTAPRCPGRAGQRSGGGPCPTLPPARRPTRHQRRREGASMAGQARCLHPSSSLKPLHWRLSCRPRPLHRLPPYRGPNPPGVAWVALRVLTHSSRYSE